MAAERIEERLRTLAEWTRHALVSPDPQPRGIRPDEADALADLVAATRQKYDEGLDNVRIHNRIRAALATLDEAANRG